MGRGGEYLGMGNASRAFAAATRNRRNEVCARDEVAEPGQRRDRNPHGARGPNTRSTDGENSSTITSEFPPDGRGVRILAGRVKITFYINRLSMPWQALVV